MAGIYVHIPFCRSKCYYCGFYSVASFSLKESYIAALCREMELRADYLPERRADTLYFGGGTPSCLSEGEVEVIVGNIREIWHLPDDTECTIEVNPEDVTPDKLACWKNVGFNRLSIGVQSFDDEVLKRINRRHSACQAMEAVEAARKAGFDNIGVDLIIGLPGVGQKDLEREMEIINQLDISHVSVYILSIDSNSVFEKLTQQGKFSPQEDDVLADHYLFVSDYLKSIGFEHYEISNFAKCLKYSRHNTAYWRQQPYLGLGAAAHSFDMKSRQWNVAHLSKYIESVNSGVIPMEREELDSDTTFNDIVTTALRTSDGINLNAMEQRLGTEYKDTVIAASTKHIRNGLMEISDNHLRLTSKGIFISDSIMSDLMIV